MAVLRTRVGLQPSVLSPKLVKLERCGRYEDALRVISEGWAAPGEMPDVKGVEPAEAAHLQLRYGALVGFHGHSRAISGSQARSKDLLTNALRIFSKLDETERVAECQNFIALAYWRTGEYREADVWVNEALALDLPPTSDARFYSHVVRSLLLMSTGRNTENVSYCRSLEESFRMHADAFLNGSLFSNLGLSLKDLGETAEALAYLDLANAFHERSRHRPYLGTVKNNLALLYKDLGRFRMAHFSADKAIAIYKKISDKAREGSTLETKAQIYVAEGNLSRALTTIDRSINVLRKSENTAYLAESIMTRAKVLLAQEKFADAIFGLIEAVEMIRNQAGDDAARELICQFELAMKADVTPPVLRDRPSPGEVELVVPPSITGHSDFKGVWIHNSYLDTIGISQGSLALVVNEPPGRGQPGALMDLESGEVSCGFYDAEFGIVCLAGASGEPQLFDEDKVTVLGKIVGVCSSPKNADGKMVVEPISY